MTPIAEHLAKQVELLELLDRRRVETKTPEWGRDTEFEVITRELWELEKDIEEDPGDLARMMVRVRRKHKGRAE
jgi:hypothetical protein